MNADPEHIQDDATEHEGDVQPAISRRIRGEHDISAIKKFSYSVGHFYNDLCASMWFTYLMIYLEKVLKFRSSRAGLLMLIGQVTDAVCTPLVGIASDHSILPKFMDKIGRRMSWHIIGTIAVTCSFPFIFNQCFPCQSRGGDWWEVVWFMPFIVIFQFGWASVQISHLALIPELSSVESSRASMTSLRYAMAVVANLSVFVALAWMLKSDGGSQIGPDDFKYFRTAGFLVVGCGLAVVFVFYAITREPEHGRRMSRLNSFSSEASELVRMQWTSWFGYIQFYQIALLYMLSRLFINISQVYFPFYITLTQNYDKSFVAILPMVSYLSSFVVSSLIGMPFICKLLNRKFLLFFGCCVGIANCVWMHFELPGWKIYAVSVLIGVTQAVLLVNTLAITADLINKNTESGAFVYGAMSFVDKLANGIAYQIIELINPTCDTLHPAEPCAIFYRNVMTFVPGGCLVLSLIILLTLLPQHVGFRLRRRPEEDEQNILDHEDE